MTDYERKRRDECIRLRRQHDADKREISKLVYALNAVEHSLDIAQAKLDTWEKAHQQAMATRKDGI